MAVDKRPEGYQAVTPYLIVEGAADLIDFMKSVFGANERFRMQGANGGVGHAEVVIDDSVIMLADAGEAEDGTPINAMIHLYVADCDAVYEAALAAGAISVREPANQFYGDRNAGVRDSFGNVWFLATHVEDVPPDEMERRAAEWTKQQGGG